ILTPSWPSVGSLGELPLSISVFDHDVSALDVTEITQSLTKGLGQVGATGQAARQVAYSSDLRRRLCLRGERRGEEDGAGDDLAPIDYSISASARASIEGGIVRASALAVLRLITISNLVGCSTGRSPGFVPFKILST